MCTQFTFDEAYDKVDKIKITINGQHIAYPAQFSTGFHKIFVNRFRNKLIIMVGYHLKLSIIKLGQTNSNNRVKNVYMAFK